MKYLTTILFLGALASNAFSDVVILPDGSEHYAPNKMKAVFIPKHLDSDRLYYAGAGTIGKVKAVQPSPMFNEEPVGPDDSRFWKDMKELSCINGGSVYFDCDE